MGQNSDLTVELNRERPVCPRDGSHFGPGRGPVCPRNGSCLSRRPSRRKCLCLLIFFLARLEGPTRKPRHASGFSARSRKRFLHSAAYECLSGLFAMGPVQFSCPRGVAENSFTKPGFWEHFVDFTQKKSSKTQSSLNFLQSRPRKFTKSDFSGLAPIRRVLSLNACFRRASIFKTHRHAVYQCLKKPPTFFDTLGFLKRAFRHARVRF